MMLDHARGYIGTSFQHQARAPGSKLDCVGVIVCAAKADGIDVEDFFAYGPEADPEELLRRLATFCDQVPVDARAPDDILAFWLVERSKPQHVALYEGAGFMIHAYARPSRDGKVRREALAAAPGAQYARPWLHHLHSVHRVKPSCRKAVA